jgi:hypothetical protein
VKAGSNTSTVALRVVGGDVEGSLESETVNMITSPKGLRPENDCAGDGQPSRQRERPTSTHPQLSDSNKYLVLSPRWVLYSKTRLSD